jgi:hypothetical protein
MESNSRKLAEYYHSICEAFAIGMSEKHAHFEMSAAEMRWLSQMSWNWRILQGDEALRFAAGFA